MRNCHQIRARCGGGHGVEQGGGQAGGGVGVRDSSDSGGFRRTDA